MQKILVVVEPPFPLSSNNNIFLKIENPSQINGSDFFIKLRKIEILGFLLKKGKSEKGKMDLRFEKFDE